MKYLIIPSFGLLLLSGCASLETSIGLGAGIGAATGALAGHSANFNTKGMALTTITGAAFGGFVGYLIHKRSGQKSAEATITSSSLPPGSEPLLKDAEKEVLLIPGKIEGDKFTEPHRVFLIKRPSHWELPPEESEVKDEKPGSTAKGQKKSRASH